MLKKSKLFVIAIAFVAVFAVASVASAADLGSTTLRKGSTGPYVVTLQTMLGVSADGAFGPMTEAAVKAWQASHGLVADGIVGPATKAAMNSASGVTPPPASGCQAGWTVNPMTGAPCTAQLPAGCLPGYMFSPTSGAKCVAGTTPTPNVSGDEADLTWSVVEEGDIAQDSTEQHAFTIEIEADEDGGDALVERLDLTLVTKLDTVVNNSYRAISRVSLEVDGDVVAESDTDSRSDWRNSSYNQLRFSDLDLVVKSGEVLEVNVLLDVNDKADEVSLTDIGYRYSDATGYVETDTEDFDAIVLINVPDAVSFGLVKNTNSPKDASLDVSSSVSDKTLVIADVEVREGEGTLEEVLVKVNFDGATNLDQVKALMSRFALKVDGTQVDSISSSSFVDQNDDDIANGNLVLAFDADEFDFEDADEFKVELLGSFRSYDSNVITAVQVTNITLKGYDSLKDEDFSTPKSITGGIFTITEGDITVDIADSSVAVGEPLGTGATGSLEFEVTVTNETGDILDNLLTAGTPGWVFEIKGYSGVTFTSVAYEDGEALTNTDQMVDGAETTFAVTATYTQKVTNQAFTIEVKSIDGQNIGYIWRD